MSPAYYNEHDAHAAAWLRNLIADGQIAPGEVMRAQDPWGCNASYPVGDGTLGTAPTPSPATSCSQPSVFGRGARVLAGGLSQLPAFPRTLRKPAVQLGSAHRNDGSDYRQAAFLSCALCKWLPFAVVAHETSELIWHCLLFCMRQSRAIYCIALSLSEMMFRIGDTHGSIQAQGWQPSYATALCIASSNTCDGCVIREVPCRTRRNEVEARPRFAPLFVGVS